MSTLKADDITDSAGTGGPKFSQGLDLSSTGGFNKYLQSAKSADYTVTDTDNIHTVLMTTGGTDRTVTLPTAADNTGRVITIKKVDSGSGDCTVDGEGAETIEGATTYVLVGQYASLTIICDGTTWHLLEATYRFESLTSISSGDFTSGQLDIARIGKQVTVTMVGSLGHSSASSAASAASAIASTFRPQGTITTARFDGSGHLQFSVAADGSFNVSYRDYSGTSNNRTSANQLSVTYVVS